MIMRINDVIVVAHRNGIKPTKIRLGRDELAELSVMCYESVPSDRVTKGTQVDRDAYLARLLENQRGFETGEHFMGIPIVKMDADSWLEVV